MGEDRRSPTRRNGAARDEAYTAIRRCVKSRIAEFYKDHAEWVEDERSRRGIESLVVMLRCILTELDRFEITRDRGRTQ